MNEQNINKSCWADENTRARVAENDNICPICISKGIEVTNNTVKHLVVNELAEQVEDYNYFVCMNEVCNVVYFSPSIGRTYTKEQLKVPIWFKKDANPKYICYCNQVTEQQIIDAVLINGARDIKDIIRITGAMKNGKCESKNPLGKCCSPYIIESIKKALSMNG